MKKMFTVVFICFGIAFSTYSQTNITGKVTSAEDAEPLPGVSVIVKGTTQGTVTDIEGNYSLSAPQDATLVFSFVGMTSEEVAVNGQSTINVQMTPDIKQLSEVVVVGYGTQIKSDLTGNIAQINGEALENIPVPSFEQAMQGRSAGVLVSSQNGKVGQGINIRIRGGSSITAGNEPLYVIDGIPVTTDNQSRTSAATNPLADINFNDIESIDILKDASAAAIYGSRAANGVVLITTKQGKQGKTQFNANFQYGISKPTGHREWLNAAEYVELYREAAYNNDVADGFDPINNPADYPGSWLEYMEETFDFLSGDTDWRTLENSTDWEKEAFQDAQMSSFDLSASGGNEKTQFYASGSISDQDGILIGNNFKRISGRLNLDHSATDKLKLGLNVGISKTANNRVTDDNEFSTPMQLVAQSPLTPVRDKDGELYDDALNPAMFYYPATVELENSHFVTTVFRNLVNTSISYDLTEDLTVKGEYGFDLLTQHEDRYQNSKTQTGRGDVNGYGTARWVRIFNNTSRIYLNWNKTLGVSNFDITGGFEFQKSTRDQTNVEGQGYPIDNLKTVASAAEIVAGSGTLNEFSFLSYFARANYKLHNRYLLSLSGRVDASSRFGANNQYGFFPAAAAGWIISNEQFLSNNDLLSFLKLRVSYGITGNAEIGNYDHFGTYTPVGYNQTSGLRPDQIPNPDLEWEKTAQLDFGLDFGLWSDKLSGEIDYYIKKTSGLLLDVPVPATTGYRSQLQNVGELENSGIEFVLNYNAISQGDFRWTTSINLAKNNNKVTQLNGDQEIIDSGSSRWLNVVKVGEPIGVFYGVEYAGVDPANGDALFFVNGETPGETTSDFNEANKIILGNPTPDFIGGWSNNLSFKGIELNFLFQWATGNKIFNGAGGFMSANGRYEDNQTKDQLRRWQNPGDITDVPQARLYSNNGAQASSRYLSDGSYVRLKTITLAYNLPENIFRKIGFTNARIYVTGQNILTFTDYDGWDPEVNTDYRASNINLGNDFYAAPQAKTYTLGIKVGF